MSKFSVKKPLTVFVAVIAILVLGVVAYFRMTPDLLPNMDFPYVLIMTAYPGASPEKVEQEITKPMEQAMSTLDHIQEVTSVSSENVGMVILEFTEGVNMDTVGVDIQQEISQLSADWSDTVGTPYVLKINPSMLPVEVAAVSMEGMDTVELKGKGYELFVQAGDHVQKGQLLFRFDLQAIAAAGYTLTTPVIVTNSSRFAQIELLLSGRVTAGQQLLRAKM